MRDAVAARVRAEIDEVVAIAELAEAGVRMLRSRTSPGGNADPDPPGVDP